MDTCLSNPCDCYRHRTRALWFIPSFRCCCGGYHTHYLYRGVDRATGYLPRNRVDKQSCYPKDPANPIFKGTGQAWDSCGVREAEIFTGSRYFHILYGGSDGEVWRVGHVRTNDFRTFEPNSDNPVFTPSPDSSAWDCDGILTPQVIEIDNIYYMVYAGKRGNEWQTGLAKARKELGDDTSTYPNVC